MEFKINLNIALSILKCYKMKHLTEYLIIESLKKEYRENIIQKDYYSWDDVKDVTVCPRRSEWEKIMSQLCNLGVARKEGDKYTTTKKVKPQFYQEAIIKGLHECLKVNPIKNHIFLMDTQKVLSIKDKKLFEAEIYISILGLFYSKKCFTREFIFEITGIKKGVQRRIERENPELMRVLPNFVIVDQADINPATKKEYGSNAPLFPAFVYSNLKDVQITDNKKSNAWVKQTGNQYHINPNYKPLIREHFIGKDQAIKNVPDDENKKQICQNDIVHNDNQASQEKSSLSADDYYDNVYLLTDLDKENDLVHRNYISVNNMNSIGYKKFNQNIGITPHKTYGISANGTVGNINKFLCNQKIDWQKKIL